MAATLPTNNEEFHEPALDFEEYTRKEQSNNS
jgi:hypothetical protein